MASLLGVQFIVSILGLVALVPIYRNWKKWRSQVFAWLYSKFQYQILAGTREKRRELLEELHRMVSNNPELRQEGPGVVRVLEVGAGPGLNLQFYPKGCRLITLDPNEHFLPSFWENKAKAPDVLLENHYCGYGEDMSQIPDGSMDAVVITFVFCSFNNGEKALEEVHRVLVPGGKLLFMEHGPFHNRWGRWAQTIIEPLWKQTGDNCHLLRPTLNLIRKSKLKVERHFYYLAKEMGLLLFCAWPQFVGVATKDVEDQVRASSGTI